MLCGQTDRKIACDFWVFCCNSSRRCRIQRSLLLKGKLRAAMIHQVPRESLRRVPYFSRHHRSDGRSKSLLADSMSRRILSASAGYPAVGRICGIFSRQYVLKARIASSRRYLEASEASAVGRNDSPPTWKRISMRCSGGPN